MSFLLRKRTFNCGRGVSVLLGLELVDEVEEEELSWEDATRPSSRNADLRRGGEAVFAIVIN